MSVSRPVRVVLLDPHKQMHTPALVLEYTMRHGFDVVCVAGCVQDALHELAHGRADVILALSTKDLRPLVRIVTEPDGPVPDSERRPQRTSPSQRRPELLR